MNFVMGRLNKTSENKPNEGDFSQLSDGFHTRNIFISLFYWSPVLLHFILRIYASTYYILLYLGTHILDLQICAIKHILSKITMPIYR